MSDRQQSVAVLSSIIFVVFSFLSQWSCKNETSTCPIQPAEATYLFVAFHVVTTQTVIEAGGNYTPTSYSYCCFMQSGSFAMFDEDPFCNFIEGPCYKFDPYSQILRIFNLNPFTVDSTLLGIYYWGNLHLRGGCLNCPDIDIAGYKSLPFAIPYDTLVTVLEVQNSGATKLLVHGQNFTLSANDSLKYFLRRDTVLVHDIVPPDTIARDHTVLASDTLVIKNHGLLPRKLILFESNDN